MLFRTKLLNYYNQNRLLDDYFLIYVNLIYNQSFFVILIFFDGFFFGIRIRLKLFYNILILKILRCFSYDLYQQEGFY